MNVPELLDSINARHGTHLRLVGRLPGGTRGAWEVAGPDGRRAVLKRGQGAAWLDRARRAAVVSEQMRVVGYPTARYLVVGETPDGTAYQIHEFLPGTAPSQLTEGTLETILTLVELQAGRCATPERSWSAWARGIVFADGEGWAGMLRAHSDETGELMRALDAAAARHRDAPLGEGDVVHGDFSAEHVLMVDGRVTGVVDFDQVGCGTRALDLAVLLGRHHEELGPRLRDRPHGRIVGIAGPVGAAVCLAYQVVDGVAWAARHADARWQAHALRVGRALVERIQGLG